MRNTYFLIGLLLASFSINSYGQDAENMKLRLVGGINYSHPLTIFSFDHLKGKQGYYLGASVNFRLSRKIQFNPELLFFRQGFKNDFEDLTLQTPDGPFVGTLKSKTSEPTIAIPLLFQYRIGNSLYLQGGPQLGYVVGQRYKEIENTFPPRDPKIAVQYDYYYNEFDAGAVAGIGYEIGHRFDVNVRYFLALTKRENYLRSSVFSLGMGYGICP